MPPSARLARIRQLILASTPTLQTSPSSIDNIPPPGATLAHHSLLESQPDSEGEYLERSQRSRTPSEKGALLAASNARRQQASARAQRGRARNAQKAARKAARSSASGYEDVADGTQAENLDDSQDYTYQEETLVDGPTLQRAFDSYAAAQPSNPASPFDNSLDLPTHSPRLPPPSIHGSSTIISPPQPVAPGSGHHISHPAIQRQMKRSINANQPAAKRPRVEHTLSDAETEVPETEDEQSFHAPTSAQPLRRFRSSIQITSSPALSAHPSRSPSPLPRQDPQEPPEGTQTIPEDPEVDQVNTQTVPETPTQHAVPNIVGSGPRGLSQASSVSLGGSAPDPPRTRLDPRVRAVQQPGPTASHPTSSPPFPLSQRTARARPTPNDGPSASQRAPPPVLGLSPSRLSTTHHRLVLEGGVFVLGVGLGVVAQVGHAPVVGVGVARLFGREDTSVERAPTLPPDAPLDGTSQPRTRTQPPSTNPRANDRPNQAPTAPAPRTTSGPSNPNQPNRTTTAAGSSGGSVRPPTSNHQPPPDTPAGPSSTRTKPTALPPRHLLSTQAPPPRHLLNAQRWATQTKLTGSDTVAHTVRRLRAQIAAARSSDPALTCPTPENGADLVSDDEEERAAEEAAANGRDPNGGRSKPSSRNTHGVARMVLQLAKLHFFAYVLTEGPYQTRAVLAMWIRIIWRETWLGELPGVPFRDVTDEEIQVIIAGVVTLRGRVKERLRTVVAFMIGFNRFAMTPEEVALNVAAFESHHPNSFHCAEVEPERRGHYESELMHHAFAVGLFHNEGAVGAVYQEYFENMEPATVAFILANLQFCLEEWSTGRHENRDLSTGQMLAKFESHLMAWKGFRRAAPRRARNLTREWFEYGLHYSGAGQPADEQGLLPSQVAEFRADTPTPEELDEPNETLDEQIAYTEQARELGLDEEFGETLGEGVDEGLMQEVDEDMADLWAQEWVDDEEWEHDWDDDEGVEGGEREEDDAGPAAEEPVQYYDDGRISAQSKGKGRATH